MEEGNKEAFEQHFEKKRAECARCTDGKSQNAPAFLYLRLTDLGIHARVTKHVATARL